jgi:hypothetical protein
MYVVKGGKTLAQIASEFEFHPNHGCKGKDQLLSMLTDLFSDRWNVSKGHQYELEADLIRQLGKLRVKNE